MNGLCSKMDDPVPGEAHRHLQARSMNRSLSTHLKWIHLEVFLIRSQGGRKKKKITLVLVDLASQADDWGDPWPHSVIIVTLLYRRRVNE